LRRHTREDKHLSKIAHLAIVRKTSEHAHAGHSHPEHAVRIEWVVAIRAALDLLLLLLLLRSERGGIVGTELGAHYGTIGLRIDGKRGSGVEGTVCKPAAVGLSAHEGGLGNVGTRTVAIVGECIACRAIDGTTIGLVRECGRPTRFFGVRTANGFDRALMRVSTAQTSEKTRTFIMSISNGYEEY